jgi:dihydroorotase
MRGGFYEQDTRDMDGKMTGYVAQRYKDYIVGIKVAHYNGAEWTPIDEAIKAAKFAATPVMIDFGSSTPPLSIEELFMNRLRPGDIFTHCFGEINNREPIVDTATKKLKPFVLDAQKKGIAFDVGYGGISFAFSQALPAVKNGFYPNSISTDIHIGSMNAAMKDILNIMSKFMAIGMSLEDVIKASTWNPAKEIRHEELGNLSAGAIADVAILSVREGKFGFFDYTGYKIEGRKKFECELTIKGGKIVYDLNGIAAPIVLPRPRQQKKP